jgi:hypothetical protein
VPKPNPILDFLWPPRGINRKLDVLLENQNTIMATQAEIAAAIRESSAQIRKAIDEVLAKIAALEQAIKDNPPAQEVIDAVAELRVASQAADDVVPDGPTPPTP